MGLFRKSPYDARLKAIAEERRRLEKQIRTLSHMAEHPGKAAPPPAPAPARPVPAPFPKRAPPGELFAWKGKNEAAAITEPAPSAGAASYRPAGRPIIADKRKFSNYFSSGTFSARKLPPPATRQVKRNRRVIIGILLFLALLILLGGVLFY